jgi:hypothetical protein
MIQIFIEEVLGVNVNHQSSHHGLYGDTQAYYGTVEQQGRLTLHLHLLLWIKEALTPQQMCTRIMDTQSDFQTCLVAWLESCCQGEYYNSTHDEVVAQVELIQQLPEYKNPTETMPSPLSICTIPEPHEKCKACANFCTWWGYFTHRQ